MRKAWDVDRTGRSQNYNEQELGSYKGTSSNNQRLTLVDRLTASQAS
jgi:hypothetical protein